MRSQGSGLGSTLDTSSRALSWMLGGGAVGLAVAVASTSLSAPEIIQWAEKALGSVFLTLMGGLVFASLYCWVQVTRRSAHQVWLEAGLQAAGGVATLALTYTLFGVSAGVGVLAEQTLSPDTVQVVIREITAKFSLAFMTTVIGLPVATVLRSMLLITHARTVQTHLNEKD